MQNSISSRSRLVQNSVKKTLHSAQVTLSVSISDLQYRQYRGESRIDEKMAYIKENIQQSKVQTQDKTYAVF